MNCPSCGQPNADSRSQCEKCGASLKPPADPANFAQALLAEQGKLPTRSSEIKAGLGGLLTAILAAGIFIAVLLWLKSSDMLDLKALGPLGILIGPVGIFAALIYPFVQLFRIGKGLFTANREITCPECGTHFSVLNSEKSFLCPKCATAYRLPDKENGVIKVTCPDCATVWISTPNAGAAQCHGCGAEMLIKNGTAQFVQQTARCPACGKPTFANAAACKACGALIVSPTLPEKSFLRSTGKFYTAAFNDTDGPKIPAGQNGLTIQRQSGYAALAQAQWQGKAVALELEQGKTLEFTRSIQMISHLLKGISALNVVLDEDPNYAQAVLETLQKYDVVVRRMLQAAVDPSNGIYLMKTNFQGPSSYTVGQGKFSSDPLVNETLLTISTEYNRLAERLEKQIGTEVPLWPAPVFKIESSGSYNNVTFAISDWQTNLAQNRLVQIPLDTPLPVFAMPV